MFSQLCCSAASVRLYSPLTYQALIRCAEDVIHTVAEILLVDGQTGERWFWIWSG